MFEVLIKLMRGRMGWINLRVLHEEFLEDRAAELDYVQEGRNAERFRLNFKPDERIVIPRCTGNFLAGKSLPLNMSGDQDNRVRCDQGLGSGLPDACQPSGRSVCEDDLRPRFFPLRPASREHLRGEGPTIVFVDFGMVQAITDTTREISGNMPMQLSENDVTGIVEALEKLGFLIEGADYKTIADVTPGPDR